jgi:5-methylcytosine-specific restriction endonuclease McrA
MAIPPKVRKAVTERDGGRCRWCGAPATEQHHVVYRSQGGKDEESNLVSLCGRHHALAHSDKRRYMPLLLAALEYQRRGINVSVSQVARWLEVRSDSEEADL